MSRASATDASRTGIRTEISATTAPICGCALAARRAAYFEHVDGETQPAIQPFDASCKVVSSSSAGFEDESTRSGVPLSDIGYCVCKRSEMSGTQELLTGGHHFGAVTEFVLKGWRAS
jgi:hypothetical protein